MDAIQITLAIAAATFAAAVTFAKANAGAVDYFSGSPALLAGEPSPQDYRPFNDRQIIEGPGFSLEVRD